MISISQSKLGSQISRITKFLLGDAGPAREHLTPTVASTSQTVSVAISSSNQREFQVRTANQPRSQKNLRYTSFSNLDFFPYLQLDSRGRVIRANTAFFQQFALDRENIIGLPISCFVQYWETASLLKSLADSARITSVVSKWQCEKSENSVPVLLYISYEQATRLFHVGIVPQTQENIVSL